MPRQHPSLTFNQRMKAERILPPALSEIARYLNCTPDLLVRYIKNHPILFQQSPTADEPAEEAPPTSPPATEPAPIPEQPDGVALGANTASPISNPEPPMIVFRNKNTVAIDEKLSTGLVTLRLADGPYLNLDGSGTTDSKHHAYRGTVAQARVMRDRNPIAKGMGMRHFEQRTGK